MRSARSFLVILVAFGLATLAPCLALASAKPPPPHGSTREPVHEERSGGTLVLVLGLAGGAVVVGGGAFALARTRAKPAKEISAGGGGAPGPIQAAGTAAAPGPAVWQWTSKRSLIEDWDYKNETARGLVKELLARGAALFGDAQVKEFPDDERIDLRGAYDGAPIRFSVWMAFGSFWAIEMQCDNRLGELDVERDEEKIPAKGADPLDPWSKNETRRVFVGKGIFVEGTRDFEEKIGAWTKLPPETQTSILSAMVGMKVRHVRAMKNVSLSVEPDLRKLDDPVDYMHQCARLMADVKNAVAKGDRDPSTVAPGVRISGNVVINGVPMQPSPAPSAAVAMTPAYAPLTCKFCSSIFLLVVGRSVCPNCGAHATQ